MLDLICAECCHPRPDRHTSKCTIGLAKLFEIIRDRLPDLTWWPQRAQLGEGGGSGGFESSPPINLHNYAMTSPASKVDPIGPDDTGPLPIYVLWEWEAKAASIGGDWEDGLWVTQQPWIGDMVADLRTMAVQLRSATGDPPPRPIGKCQRTIGLGVDDLIVCGEPLYMPEVPEVSFRGTVTVWDCPTVKCPRPECREEYTGSALLRLKLIADRERRHSRSGLLTGREGAVQRAGFALYRDWSGPVFYPPTPADGDDMPDELDPYLERKMRDPGFRAAYEAAEREHDAEVAELPERPPADGRNDEQESA